MRGLHPEPKGSHLYVDMVRHYRRGHFIAGAAGSMGARPPPSAAAGQREESLIQAPDPCREGSMVETVADMPPEMLEWACAIPEELEWHQAPAEAEGEEEDIFGHGGDIGESAYFSQPAAAGEAEASEDEEAPPQKKACRRNRGGAEGSGTGPAEAAAAPPAKRTRLVGKQAPEGPALEAVEVPASFDGLEQRLRKFGEIPRFQPTDYSFLEHQCTSVKAVVRFWPNTLLWCTEGLDSDAVDVALAAPMPEEKDLLR